MRLMLKREGNTVFVSTDFTVQFGWTYHFGVVHVYHQAFVSCTFDYNVNIPKPILCFSAILSIQIKNVPGIIFSIIWRGHTTGQTVYINFIWLEGIKLVFPTEMMRFACGLHPHRDNPANYRYPHWKKKNNKNINYFIVFTKTFSFNRKLTNSISHIVSQKLVYWTFEEQILDDQRKW